MSRSFACIISADMKQNREALLSVARRFAYLIEVLDDGILFDVSGLERLIGGHEKIAQKIVEEIEGQKVSGSIAVAGTIETAMLLARQNRGLSPIVRPDDRFRQAPLSSLPIEQDTLNVLNELDITKIEDMLRLPHEDLLSRYGQEFRKVIDLAEQNGKGLLSPNVYEDHVSWSYSLDSPVEDFAQLVFLLNHGLERLFEQVSHRGLSTESIGLCLRLRDSSEKSYEISTSFPTLERAFWLKLANLRISLDPPGSEIVSVDIACYFTKPRPAQHGLYAVSRPEPEDLLLTINKLKKLAGEENVGVPVILDQRLPEPFEIDVEAIPEGRESSAAAKEHPVIAFSYFRPPIRAEVLVRNKRLVFIKTGYFNGYVTKCSGVWRSDSRWWESPWRSQEWDVEIENGGVYRLCRADDQWFIAGEYD